jgi:chromosome partitioning protein
MPAVVAVLNQKGGSGKTTIATNLARGLQLEGLDVLIADADPQRTASEWGDLRDEDLDLPPVVGVNGPTIENDLQSIGAAYDVVVIDGAPALDSLNVKALKASDVVLLPVRPSGPDVWAGEELVDLIHTRRDATGGSPKAAFVVSQQVARTNLAGEIGEILDAYGLPVLDGRTGQRVAYAEALSVGTTVLDMAGASKAESEIREITTGVLDLLQSTVESNE